MNKENIDFSAEPGFDGERSVDSETPDVSIPETDGSEPSGQTGEQPADQQHEPDGEQISQEEDEQVTCADQLAAMQDKYIRLMAEFDNFKRRTSREYEKLVESANERLLQDFITVREHFLRALENSSAAADIDSYITGMKLIFDSLEAVLNRHGLESFAQVGEPFDPAQHDAMMQMPHEQIAQNHIVQVFEKGYKLKGRIIRHARVIVSSGSPVPQDSGEETTEQ